MRCFQRTVNALKNDTITKELVLSDYVNKKHAVFLKDVKQNAAVIKEYLKHADIKKVRITVIRIMLTSDSDKHTISVRKEINKDCTLWTICANEKLDEECNRGLLYKKISDICLLRADNVLFKHR